MFYFVKTPWWLKRLYSKAVWDIENENTVYLTFDDGPHPSITPFVLDQLKQFNAKATFFCIGKNVVQNKSLYERIIEEGHRVGNHTQDHVNGWKTNDDVYINNIREASKHIQSDLFRPPYGRIKKNQLRLMKDAFPGMKSIMWDVLSADFDKEIDYEECIKNVLKNTRPGSIIVFHDSEKAFPRLEKALPEILKTLSQKGLRFAAIDLKN